MKIGVVAPIAAEDAGSAAVPRYSEIRAFARQAEEAGFDAVWIYDHLLYRYPDAPTEGVWESWTLLSALAEATTRVELGALVMCVPFRNPAVLAKMAVTLDEVSNGRFILGLGAGWHQPEFDAFGVPFDHKVDRFEEAIQIIAPLLREGRVDFAGAHYKATNCEILPPGPRRGGPPILVGTSGPRMLRLTARYADQWNACWLGRVEALAAPRAALEAACAAEGRDPATMAVTVGVIVDYEAATADPAKALIGSPEEIAAALGEYERAGVAQVICSLRPTTAAALSRLTEALALYRAARA